MNIKKILEKEFNSEVKIYNNIIIELYIVNVYIVYDYDKIHFFIKGNVIEYIMVFNKRIPINKPINDIYWFIYCIKNMKYNTDLKKILNNNLLKREFIIDKILTD
jgi:hypothetical protein